jgi:hypothetical protein
MPFKHACFISYCHIESDLYRKFIGQLRKALDDYVRPWLGDLGVYTDERLVPGYFFNEALASELCASLCMIVVYVPPYENSRYCLREFTAMERLEEHRLRLLPASLRHQGLIVPIVLRGDPDDLPDRIRNHRHLCDFSRFTTASGGIADNEHYVGQIERIARHIFDVYRLFQDATQDPCGGCEGFRLPSDSEIRPFRGTPPVPPFPGRA